jgi:DNA-binding GntR family transcriptional regulator
VAKYIDIAENLRVRISSGEFPVGARLPSLLELMESYGAAQHTMRHALELLKDDGVLSISQGVPTYVVKLPDMGKATALEKLEQAQRLIDEAMRIIRDS